SSPRFMYSKCTGRRRAVCLHIGINYRGQKHELRGCVNDSKHCFNFLVRRAGYHPHNIVLLTDDSLHGHSQPTRRNILDAMKGLVRDARPHDVLFFSNSGHGGQMPHLEGDEVDGYDEVIFPLEFKRAGHLLCYSTRSNSQSVCYQEMHAIMVRPLPTGCRLTVRWAVDCIVERALINRNLACRLYSVCVFPDLS
ncbi:caspase domain-containing protein, partial [Roridomyces roridus]